MDDLFKNFVKELDSKCMNDELKDMAEALRALYLNFKNAGFTPNQSMELTKEFLNLSAGIARAKMRR